MKYLFFFAFINLNIFLYSQVQENKVCVLLDVDYSGVILMYQSLDENSVIELQHDFEEEDFITFDIISKNDSMYYVEANYEINGFIGKGWIRRNVPIKIYVRNYSQSLNLYSFPQKDSPVQCEIKEYLPAMFDVLDYDGYWLKVKINFKDRECEGFLSPDMQCCNPYSTCG